MNDGRWKYSFSVTLDERLNDKLAARCQNDNIDKTCLIRQLLAKEFGLTDEIYQIKSGRRNA